MRRKDQDWNLPDGALSYDGAAVALLMDIRDELRAVKQKLEILNCPNFVDIPRKLDRIRRNTTKKKRVRK